MPMSDVIDDSGSDEQGLQLLERSALSALSGLLMTWYAEAGLGGVLRSLDAALAQCYAISDSEADGTVDMPPDVRAAICEQILFLQSVYGDLPPSTVPPPAVGDDGDR